MKNIDQAKVLLKELMTPENADKITAVVSELNEAEKEHTNLVKQHGELKDKYVESVSMTIFHGEPKSQIEPQHKTLDEIMAEELQKTIASQNQK